MRARYYSVELMRFINEDIVLGDIGNSSSLNRYTYVEGNPATMVDPFGLCGEKVGHFVDGIFSIFKGSALEGEGLAKIYAGLTIAAIGGPIGTIVGLGIALGGVYDFACGLADTYEGVQDIYLGANGISGTASNFMRDTFFHGDKETYQEIEITSVFVGNGLINLIGTMYTSMLSNRGSSVRDNASYDNSQAATEGGKSTSVYELLESNNIPQIFTKEEIEAANLYDLLMSTKKDLKMVNDAAKEIGVDRNAFGEYIHEVKAELNMKANQNFSYQELLELAEELKGFLEE